MDRVESCRTTDYCRRCRTRGFSRLPFRRRVFPTLTFVAAQATICISDSRAVLRYVRVEDRTKPFFNLSRASLRPLQTSFTYSLNSANDPTFPNGWAQPEKDEVNGQGGPDYKTDFFTCARAPDRSLNRSLCSSCSLLLNHSSFIGMSLPSPLGAFTDPSQTAIINGFPHVFFQCAQITVNTSSLLAVNGNYSSLPLYALLWWLTPANVVATCGTYNNTFTGTTAAPLPPALALDFGSPYSPFGGRSAAVVEVASAPHIAFIPANCVGAGCAPPFPSTPFVNAATPTVSSPISVASWTPSPSCNALPGGGYASAYQGTLGVVAVGNGTALSPPPPAAAQPPPPPFALSARAFTAWLISLTVVLSCVVVAALCALGACAVTR